MPKSFMRWAACVAFPALAQAAPPLATEDAGVLAAGACESESSVARLHDGHAQGRTAWSTQLGCGVGLATQVALAYSHSTTPEDPFHGLALLGKTALHDGGEAQASWAIAWGIDFVSHGWRELHRDQTYLNLVWTRTFASGLTVHANLGWLHSRAEHRGRASWNLAAEYVLQPGLDVMAETYGCGSDRPWTGIGMRWAATPRLSLNSGYAWQQRHPRTDTLTLGVVLGF